VIVIPWLLLYLAVGFLFSLWSQWYVQRIRELHLPLEARIRMALVSSWAWLPAVLLGLFVACRNWWRYRLFPRSINEPPYKKDWIDEILR